MQPVKKEKFDKAKRKYLKKQIKKFKKIDRPEARSLVERWRRLLKR